MKLRQNQRAGTLRDAIRIAVVSLGAGPRSALAERTESPRDRLEAETLVNLIRLGWGRDNPSFRQVFTNRFIARGTPSPHQ